MTRRLLLVLLILLGPACGRFARSGSEAEPEAAPESGRVGEGLEESIATTAPPTSAAPATSASPAGTSPGAAPSAPARPTSAVREDAGFRLTLSIDGSGEYNASDGAFVMTLEVRNITREVKHYDPNQPSYFVMAGAGRWRDIDCGPRKAGGAPVARLAPGQALTVKARYPGPDDRLDKGDGCRRPPGNYALGAGFEWCPPEAVNGDEAPCDTSATETARSAGLQITLR